MSKFKIVALCVLAISSSSAMAHSYEVQQQINQANSQPSVGSQIIGGALNNQQDRYEEQRYEAQRQLEQVQRAQEEQQRNYQLQQLNNSVRDLNTTLGGYNN